MNLPARLNLSRSPLEQCGAEVLAYASNDRGDMGGGLPQALMLASGDELRRALRAGLAECPRDLGDIVWTPAFKIPKARFVAHIVGVKAGEAQGDHCENPGHLEGAVYQTLALAEAAGARTVAFANLATGAGRATADEMARLMIGPMRTYFRDHPVSPVQAVICLPHYEDYQAFLQRLSLGI